MDLLLTLATSEGQQENSAGKEEVKGHATNIVQKEDINISKNQSIYFALNLIS